MSKDNIPTIRKLLYEAFINDEDLDFLCYEHFREVYESFSGSLNIASKIQLLISHCQENGLLDELLLQVKEINPSKYAEYKPFLLSTELAEQPSETRLSHETQLSYPENSIEPIVVEAKDDRPVEIGSPSKIPFQEESSSTPTEGSILTLSTKKSVDPIALGALIISCVVTEFNLDINSQISVNFEFKWLFSAVDNFLKIQKNEIGRNEPIPVEIPATAHRYQGSNNLLQISLDDSHLQIWMRQLDSMLTRIKKHLENVDELLMYQTTMGNQGKSDVKLQNQIREGRIDIIKILRELAQLMNQAYGIFVASPDQLVEFLGQ